MAVQNFFRYTLLLGVYIIPIYFLTEEEEEKFPILFFGAIGITIAYWGAILYFKLRGKKKE